MMRRTNILFVLFLLLVQVASWHPVAAGAQAAELAIQPGSLGQIIRTGMFSAQESLSAGDAASAASSFNQITDEIGTLKTAMPSDPSVGVDLDAAVTEAQTAITANDPAAYATARALIWTTILRGSYAETIAAASVGNANVASSWLLLREFRPTTKFARPGADATLAVQALRKGELAPLDAATAIRADLLDTYQAKLAAELDDLNGATTSGYSMVSAEITGYINGYWKILAPSYTEQAGPEAGTQATVVFEQLNAAVKIGDPAQITTALAAVTDLERSFRAAPLNEDEQARRAGQLVRYLSLIPVEYGRGVKNGEVVLDIEIQEADAFLEGARAAFDDLYLPLKAQDAEKTAEVDANLKWLREQIDAAAQHTSVADPGEIKSRAEGTIDILNGMFPEKWTRAGGDADFDVIDSVLDQMEAAVASGNPEQAESARLEAYAIYEVGPEKRLLAFAPDLANKTEAMFWTGNGDIDGLQVALQKGASLEEIRAIRAELDKLLDEGRQRLGAGKPATGVVIFNAATIVFREGLEGVLILASLVASMIGANRKFKKPLVVGAGLAFVATAILFWAAQTVLSSLSRYGEKLEAIVSLIAIGVLLLVMNWFFHKVYWTKWISKHHTRRRALIGGAAGQALGLVVLGFTSVFREGAETVLFLQALVLDAGTLVVIEGVAIGLIGVAIVGALVLVLQAKLPHKKMLMVTGVMIAMVLFVMVGTTVHVLQVVGWMPIDAVEGLILPYWTGVWFGIYSTWQGLAFQALSVVFVVGSYYAAEFTQERRRSREIAELAPSV